MRIRPSSRCKAFSSQSDHSFGRSLNLKLLAHLLCLNRLNRLNHLLFPRWCGEIGPAVGSGGHG
jgi:hypothetical protein